MASIKIIEEGIKTMSLEELRGKFKLELEKERHRLAAELEAINKEILAIKDYSIPNKVVPTEIPLRNAAIVPIQQPLLPLSVHPQKTNPSPQLLTVNEMMVARQYKQIKYLKREGYNTQQIADKLKLPRSTIQKRLYSIFGSSKLPSAGHTAKFEKRFEVLKMNNMGFKCKEISFHLDVSQTTVRKILEYFKLNPHKIPPDMK
jgi:DNA-binding NarL/FixJ family response regulator